MTLTGLLYGVEFTCVRLLKRDWVVGAAGFELATPCTPCKCATGLRHAPTSPKRSASYTKTPAQATPAALRVTVSRKPVKKK